jgi:hypothetical protein
MIEAKGKYCTNESDKVSEENIEPMVSEVRVTSGRYVNGSEPGDDSED